MAFQTVVNSVIAAGVPGELGLEGPLVAQPARITSADPTQNVVGRAFSVVSGATGTPLAGDAGANPAPLVVRAGAATVTSVFAGVLANPKVYASYGTAAGGPFAPTITVPNGTQGEFVTETAGIWVELPAAAAPGDNVSYTIATGVLVTAAPGVAFPGTAATQPIGRVERFVSTGANLALISLRSGRTVNT